MHYIVALGNPGEKYEHTRHNVGWQIVDYVCQKSGLPEAILQKQLSGRATSGRVGGHDVSVLYPETFMNNSGSAVVKLLPREEMDKLIVVHDDIDLPLGEIRFAKGRGDGGNNGIKSIIDKTGTKDFVRLRIGIAPRSLFTGAVKRPKGGGPLERFVLKTFSKRELATLETVKEGAYGALQTLLQNGLEAAMNKYN
jgi:PTH1 family peptidyl-tRNA hydrolase